MAKQIRLVSPIDGAIDQPVKPTFRWEVSELDAPLDLALVAATSTTLEVTWAFLSGAASYNVYVSGREEPVNAGSATCQLTGLLPLTSYTVEVAGVTAEGFEGPKASLVVETANAYSVSEVGHNSARLHWAAVPNATEYRIFNSTLQLLSVPNDPVMPNPTALVTGLTANTAYSLKVAAVVGGIQQTKLPLAGIPFTTIEENLGETLVFTAIGPQSVTVPLDATRATVKVWGAGGGGSSISNYGGSGGGGGYATGTFDVLPGESLLVYIGEGGKAGSSIEPGQGGGGGLTGLLRGSSPLIIAGSGGGGGVIYNGTALAGGAGGGTTGENGAGIQAGGKGGTQTAGGAAGVGGATVDAAAGGYLEGGSWLGSGARGGGMMYGGNASVGYGGAGGGAGYYGGGAGEKSSDSYVQGTDLGSGGGGSSFIPAGGMTFSGSGTNPGNMNDSERQPTTIGVGGAGRGRYSATDGGNGLVIIQFKR